VGKRKSRDLGPWAGKGGANGRDTVFKQKNLNSRYGKSKSDCGKKKTVAMEPMKKVNGPERDKNTRKGGSENCESEGGKDQIQKETNPQTQKKEVKEEKIKPKRTTRRKARWRPDLNLWGTGRNATTDTEQTI